MNNISVITLVRKFCRIHKTMRFDRLVLEIGLTINKQYPPTERQCKAIEVIIDAINNGLNNEEIDEKLQLLAAFL